ncbi:helicase domain protein [Nitzschia inconspicua]|uniref:Helicase domain protein n=1 Tax=Nitzschia inconspicua TaxID=303405 RepID=A0A9K3LZ78_9STRA|nr:helicase domain protein [Nitzschia inconspicua]
MASSLRLGNPKIIVCSRRYQLGPVSGAGITCIPKNNRYFCRSDASTTDPLGGSRWISTQRVALSPVTPGISSLHNPGCATASPFLGKSHFFRALSTTGSSKESTGVPAVLYDDVQALQRQLDLDDLFMIQRLMEYQEKNGDCHVPTGKSIYAKRERQKMQVQEDLATWVVKQRLLYRRHYNNDNKIRRINKSLETKFLVLESMGFMWSCRESNWQRIFNRLERFSQENGGETRVSRHDDQQLADWSDQQRKAYNRGTLSPDREALLREIDFVFDPTEEDWLKFFEQLREYKEEMGDVLVPMTSEEHPTLASWVARKRHLYKTGRLEEHRIEALDEIGFVWDAQSSSWESHYAQLIEFFNEHGHTRVPRSAGPLWSWTDRQRRSLKRLNSFSDETKEDARASKRTDSLDSASIEKLMKIGMGKDLEQGSDYDHRAKRLLDLTFEIAVHDESWMKSYRELCSFKEKYGHFSVPGKCTALSSWVRHQRYLYHRKMLPESRVALLDDIGFPWSAELARWNRMYEELLSFHRKNGHAKIPVKNAGLYRWTMQQRRNLQKSSNTTQQSMTDDMAKKMIVLREILME